MASISRHKTGWRAQVERKGKRCSKVLPTKREATDWAARQEYLIDNPDGVAAATTFGEVMDRYSREVSTTKRGERWEVVRLAKFCRDPVAMVPIQALTPEDLAGYRDRRLQEVAPASVNRELQLMSSVLTAARREWRLIRENPMADVRRPAKPQPRDRLPTSDEIERMGFTAGSDLAKTRARCHLAFLFAIETAMRAGEIAGLRAAQIDTETRVARLLHTKNGHPRDVPLSLEALRILDMLPPADPVFDLTSRQLDVLWRKSRDRAGVVGLTFHDSRAEAITRLSKKLGILDLARMVGHRDLRMLQVYYREEASSIARRLD